MNFRWELPDPVTILVWLWLESSDTASIARVCSFWSTLVKSPHIWRELGRRALEETEEVEKPDDLNWLQCVKLNTLLKRNWSNGRPQEIIVPVGEHVNIISYIKADASHIFCLRSTGSVMVFEMTGPARYTLIGTTKNPPGQRASTLDFRRDINMLITSEEYHAHIWDISAARVDEWRIVTTIKEKGENWTTDTVNCARISLKKGDTFDTAQIAVGYLDGSIRVCNARTGEIQASIDPKISGASGIRMHNFEGKHCMFVHYIDGVRVYTLDGKLVGRFFQNVDTSMVFSSFNGTQLVANCRDFSVRYISDVYAQNAVESLKDGEQKEGAVRTPEVVPAETVLCEYSDVCLSMCNKQRIVSLAYLDRDRFSIDVWDLAQKKFVSQSFFDRGEPYSISCDYFRIFMAVNDGTDILVLDFSPKLEEVMR